MAPREFEAFAGQAALVGPGRLLRRAIEADRLGSAIFFGPPGCGKTALVRLIAARTSAAVEELNAVTAGVADLRRAVEAAAHRLSLNRQKTLLVVDEIHHFNKSQQDALLPDVERGRVTLIGLTTENPYFYVNAALLSRSQVFEFQTLGEAELRAILERALTDPDRGFGRMAVTIDPDAASHLVSTAAGDARRLLNALELAVLSTPAGTDGSIRITLAIAEESIQKRALLYDKRGDQHYDIASAFIKSLRGSDPDAALYWMAKMLAAGEDPRFIARRLAIAASEDVGNADPHAVVLAASVFDLVERVGLPEAKIPLAQAVTYVACAPKSNAAYVALERAEREVADGPARAVPIHLRDATADGAGRLGHGVGYKYPHDFPGHHVEQEYWPNPVRLYEPTDQGREKDIKARLDSLR